MNGGRVLPIRGKWIHEGISRGIQEGFEEEGKFFWEEIHRNEENLSRKRKMIKSRKWIKFTKQQR